MTRLFLILSIIIGLLFFNLPSVVEGKRRSAKRKIPLAESDNDEPEEIVQYNSEAEKIKKIQELKKKRADSESMEENVSPEELEKLISEEQNLRRDVLRAVVNHGDDSEQKAIALHALGRNMYKQLRYEDVFDTAKEIVRIHEVVDGVEAAKTAMALGNVGAVAYRLGKRAECALAMNRALHIMLREYGEDAKEILMHRAKMLTYQLPEGKTGQGISYEEYRDEL